MPEYRKTFSCEVLTPDGTVCRLEAVSVVLPASDGQLGVLGGRSPMVAKIGAGLLTIDPPKGERKGYFIDGGFAEMRSGELTILAEQCQPIHRIDSEQAWQQLQEAKRMADRTDEEIAVRDRAVASARARFRLVQKHRRQLLGPRTEHPDGVADADYD